MNPCIFCKIIQGEIPAAKVWEDDNFLAFLSIHPINPGHTLVIPKKHVDYIFDLDDQTLSQLILKSKPLAQALKKVFQPKMGRVGVMVAGGEVPHVHIHLIPMNHESDLTFSRANFNVPFEEISANSQKIKEYLGG